MTAQAFTVLHLSFEKVVSGLLKAVPEFDPIYREHIKTYDELLAHVLFESLQTFAERWAAKLDDVKNAGKAEDVLKRVFGFVEELVTSPDPLVNDLAVVSFLDLLLDSKSDAFWKLRRFLGPASREALHQYSQQLTRWGKDKP